MYIIYSTGEWADGKYEGYGELEKRTSDGMYRFKGEWRGGRRNGSGICIFANMDRFEGTFFDDKATGQGLLTYAVGGEVMIDYFVCL